jgi:hypothetical protein
LKKQPSIDTYDSCMHQHPSRTTHFVEIMGSNKGRHSPLVKVVKVVFFSNVLERHSYDT